MKDIISTVRIISNEISETEKKRRHVSDYARSNLDMVAETKPKKASGAIAAVDGGIVSKSLHGMDIVLVRSGGVCFTYEEGRIQSVIHKPSRFPDYEAHVFGSMSESDWRMKANILRQKLEIERCLEMIEERPGMLLLDGSVVPHQAYKPNQDQKGCTELYEELIGRYRDLYKKSLEYGVRLVGVVEDSRSRTFCDMLKQVLSGKIDCSVLDMTRDTSLLFSMLKKGERTVLFSYSKDPANHPTLSNLPDYGKMIHSLYIKTAPHDRPLRLDFLSENPLVDSQEISSVLLSISDHHSSYGIPAPIIEADNISKLSEKDVDDFYSQIKTMTGELPDIMRMRREQRPF
ncbi:MAG: DNA double-strand break repair nuclease NurA [Candidatus Aenigmatarchaeota archaeon]|nr:DNA double-strand break repair nuclease NurA [Nanoarchaeota archaeon]